MKPIPAGQGPRGLQSNRTGGRAGEASGMVDKIVGMQLVRTNTCEDNVVAVGFDDGIAVIGAAISMAAGGSERKLHKSSMTHAQIIGTTREMEKIRYIF